MNFGEKLDLLIKIADVSSSELARAVGVDASFVSRLRRGERPPSRNQKYLRSMAVFLAAEISSDLQKTSFKKLLGVRQSEYPEDIHLRAKLIAGWLDGSGLKESDAVVAMLSRLSVAQPVISRDEPGCGIEPAPAAQAAEPATQPIAEPASAPAGGDSPAYFGIEGKQEATARFLELALSSGRPCELFLYSSEDVEWMLCDAAFTACWTGMLIRIIGAGGRITIIHSIRRGLEDMLDSIREWIPIYMTGAITPYYNPLIREEVFGRTLMTAPGIAAVTSSSIGKGVREAPTFLHTDARTVEALGAEFREYLRVCRPLMKIFTEDDVRGYADMFTEFENYASRSVIKTDALSCMTMPLETARALSARYAATDADRRLDYHQCRIRDFESRIARHPFMEILSLPKVEELENGRICTGFCDTPSYAAFPYTAADYAEHLANVVRLLETYPNYDVCLTPEPVMPGIQIYAKEREGVLVEKTSRPAVIFGIGEDAMTTAFMHYMDGIVRQHSRAMGPDRRKRTIAALRRFIRSIGRNGQE